MKRTRKDRPFTHHLRRPGTERSWCDPRCTGEVNLGPLSLDEICRKCLRMASKQRGW